MGRSSYPGLPVGDETPSQKPLYVYEMEGPYDHVKASELPVQRRCSCTRVFFWCLWVMLFAVLILGALALIMYFIFQPQTPQFDITQFHLANVSLDASITSLSALYLSAVADYTLSGYNPNKVNIDYNYINMTVFFEGAAIANSSIPAFTQGSESSSAVNGTFIMDNFPLSLAIGPAFMNLYQSGTIPFQIVSLVAAHINILGIATPSVAVELSCNVTVNLASSQPTSKVCSSVNVPLPTIT